MNDYFDGDGTPRTKIIRCPECDGDGHIYDEEEDYYAICQKCDGDGYLAEYLLQTDYY